MWVVDPMAGDAYADDIASVRERFLATVTVMNDARPGTVLVEDVPSAQPASRGSWSVAGMPALILRTRTLHHAVLIGGPVLVVAGILYAEHAALERTAVGVASLLSILAAFVASAWGLRTEIRVHGDLVTVKTWRLIEYRDVLLVRVVPNRRGGRPVLRVVTKTTSADLQLTPFVRNDELFARVINTYLAWHASLTERQ